MRHDYIVTRHIALIALILMCQVIVCEAVAQPAHAVSAGEYFTRITGNPNLKKNPKGESFCWHAASGMDTFVRTYEATGDTSWLDYGVKYYDFLIENLDTAPDGYRGWIGPYMYDNQYWCDVHVGDAILWKGILDFSVLALGSETLKRTYGAKARSYADLAARHCIEKWDARGTWRDDGPAGAYVSWSKYLAPGDLSAWLDNADVKGSTLSLPFNKQNDMAQVCIQLHHITGERFYRERAEKIFTRMKRSFQFFDDHYVWNYWEPFGPWDIDMEKRLPLHWVGVHPYRNYQAGEVDQIVDAYHSGIVFDETDIQRIVNTNLKVMWNGDREKPEFSNSNITHVPKRELTPESGYSSLAGNLWTSLVDFSQTTRDLYSRQLEASPVTNPDRIYYERITEKTPPGFGRKRAKNGAITYQFDFTECRYLNMAAVIPCVIPKDEEALIICKAWACEDTLEIALYPEDGARKLATLEKTYLTGDGDGLGGIHMYRWNDRRDLKGDYRIRWTFGGEYREFPVTLE